MPAIALIAPALPSSTVTAGKSIAKQTAATVPPQPATNASTVVISQAGQDALSSSSASGSTPTRSNTPSSIDSQLAEIKAKDATSRTAADVAFLQANDTKLAGIMDKINKNLPLNSSEVDYQQKTMGFVNTFSLLSTDEKALYDKAIASGNPQAAAGISQIAFERTLGHTAGGAPETTYDPINTAITADNVKNYFSFSIVDPSGNAKSNFQALIQFLQNNPPGKS